MVAILSCTGTRKVEYQRQLLRMGRVYATVRNEKSGQERATKKFLMKNLNRNSSI